MKRRKGWRQGKIIGSSILYFRFQFIKWTKQDRIPHKHKKGGRKGERV